MNFYSVLSRDILLRIFILDRRSDAWLCSTYEQAFRGHHKNRDRQDVASIVVCNNQFGMNLDTSLGLKCYNCTTRWEFDACVLHPNQTNFITCETHQNVCMVQRNETFGKFEVLVRRCATSCLPHCGIWGDDIDTERCYSCCTTDLCNTDNSANKRPVLSVTFNMINIFLLLYMYSNTFS